MITASVIAGSGWLWKIWNEQHGMLNAIVSVPGVPFASVIASPRLQRSMQFPSLVGSVVLTVKRFAAGTPTFTQSENSDVLPSASVAVAVSHEPGAAYSIAPLSKVKSPAAFDEMTFEPSHVCPSPLPLGSQLVLA